VEVGYRLHTQFFVSIFKFIEPYVFADFAIQGVFDLDKACIDCVEVFCETSLNLCIYCM